MISVLWGRHLESRGVVRSVIPRCGDSFVCLFRHQVFKMAVSDYTSIISCVLRTSDWCERTKL